MRRTRRIVALIAALGSVAALAVAAPSAGARPVPSSWPQTKGSAALSRTNYGERTLGPGNANRIRLLHSIQPPPFEPDYHCLVGATAAVLSGGYAYSILGNQLSKVSLRSGAVRWSTTASFDEDTRFIDLAVVGGIVVADFLGCHSESDPSRTVRAFDAATGRIIWAASSTGAGNMVVSGGYVVAIGGSPGSGLSIHAYRLRTGAVAWSKDFSCQLPSIVAVVNGLVIYTACTDSGTFVEADRLRTGATVWTNAAVHDVSAGDLDTIGGRHVFVHDAGGALQDLDPATGTSRYTLAGATAILAVGWNRVFATCAGGAVCAYQLRTGRLLWSRSYYAVGGAAALANGVLYLSSGLAVRAVTGAPLAYIGPLGSLAVGNGRLVVPVNPGNFLPSYLAIYGLAGS